MAATSARSINLLDEARKPFLEVADNISDALVYLDAPFGEAAYYNLGLSFLYGLGATAVCSLEDASVNDAVAASIGGGSAKLERVVIFTGRLLNDSHRHILRALRAHHEIRKCTIFCAVSEAAHADYPGGLLSLDAYSQYAQLLREDLEKSGHNTAEQNQGKESKKESKPDGRSGSNESGDGWDAWSDEDRREGLEAGPSARDTTGGGLGELSRVLREARRSQEPEERWDAGSEEWAQERDAEDSGTKLQISVRFFPGLLCSLAPGAFVLPSSAAVTQAPLCLEHSPDEDGTVTECLGRGLPSVGGPLGGDEALPAGVSLLAHALGEMLAQLDLKPELFSFGPTSWAIAKVMTELPTVETRTGVGVVLVDRTLELLTPASHADNFLDRLVAALPQRPSGRPLPQPAVPATVASTPIWREPLDFRVPLGDLFPSALLMEDDFSESSKTSQRRERESNSRVGATGGETLNGMQKLGGNGAQWLGGALFQPSDAQATERLESFLTRRNSKDALMALRRALQEAVRTEKLPAPRLKLGAIGPSEILSLLSPLESQHRLALKHRALIQLARASAHALDAPHGPRWETLASTEKIMALSAAEEMNSLVAQLKELVVQNKTEVEGGETSVINLRDILTLAVVAYSLAGDLSPSNRRSSTGGPVESPFPWEDELALQEAVVDSVLAGLQPVPLGFIDGLEASLEAMWEKRRKENEASKGGGSGRESEGEVRSHEEGGLKEPADEGGESRRQTEGDESEGGWEETNDGWDADWGVDEDDPPGPVSDEEAYDEVRLRLEVKDRVEEVFSKLRLVAAAQQRLHGFRYLEQGPGAPGATTTGLLKQLVAKICAREEVPGLEHAASVVKKLLQTGLGRFGFQNFQSGPKPGDCKVVLVFVVGGLTLGEIKDVREALMAPPGQEAPEVIIGGTTLLTPGKLYEELFDKSR